MLNIKRILIFLFLVFFSNKASSIEVWLYDNHVYVILDSASKFVCRGTYTVKFRKITLSYDTPEAIATQIISDSLNKGQKYFSGIGLSRLPVESNLTYIDVNDSSSYKSVNNLNKYLQDSKGDVSLKFKLQDTLYKFTIYSGVVNIKDGDTLFLYIYPGFQNKYDYTKFTTFKLSFEDYWYYLLKKNKSFWFLYKFDFEFEKNKTVKQ